VQRSAADSSVERRGGLRYTWEQGVRKLPVRAGFCQEVGRAGKELPSELSSPVLAAE
jgi:hypothetical protein